MAATASATSGRRCRRAGHGPAVPVRRRSRGAAGPGVMGVGSVAITLPTAPRIRCVRTAPDAPAAGPARPGRSIRPMADPDAPIDRPRRPAWPTRGPAAPTGAGRSTPPGCPSPCHEWGDPAAPPLVLAHGGFDFAGTLDVFAPMLADGGWRVVAWDQRGHGDSDRAALYSWEADLRDAAAVVDSVGAGPGAVPRPLQGRRPDDAPGQRPAPPGLARWSTSTACRRTRPCPTWPTASAPACCTSELTSWLDHRRTLVGKQRRPGTIDELAARRGRMNPRLDPEWLRYLVTVGARHDADGWRWKIDPTMRLGGFGPWRPEWSMLRLPGIGVPVLGVLGLELEVMGWGTRPERRDPVPAARGPVRGARGRRALRPHRAAPAGGRHGPGVPVVSSTDLAAPQPHRAGPAPPGRRADPRPGRCCCCTAWASAPRRGPGHGRRVARAGAGPRLHRPRALDRARRRRVHLRDPDGRRRRRAGRGRRRHASSAAAWGPTSACSSPRPARKLVRGVVLADGPGLVGGGVHPGLADAALPAGRTARVARSLRPARSCPATCGPPTTPRPSCASWWRAATSTSRCGCRRWCARSGSRRWPPSPVWVGARCPTAWPATPRLS